MKIEERYQLPAEPPYSCVYFDAAISSIRKGADVSDIEFLIEEARTLNADIREWGNAWKDKAICLIAEVEDALRKIDEKDDLVSEMTREMETEINELKEELLDKDRDIRSLEDKLYDAENRINELESQRLLNDSLIP